MMKSPVDCPHCEASFSVSLSKEGKSAKCSKCQRPFVISFAEVVEAVLVPDGASPASEIDGSSAFTADEQVLKKDGITIGEFLQFTNALLDREMVLKFDDGTSTNASLGSFRLRFDSADRADYVYSDSTHAFVLKTIRSKHGWLCLEFGSKFKFIQAQIFAEESGIANVEAAKLIVKLLRKIDAVVDVGITREQLHSRLTDGWLEVKDFITDHETEYPKFASLVAGAFENYKTAFKLWDKGAAEIPFEFSGGGFGLVGAAKGMAVGAGLQSLANVFNSHQSNKLQERLTSEFWYASRKIEVVHNVMRGSWA